MRALLKFTECGDPMINPFARNEAFRKWLKLQARANREIDETNACGSSVLG
jgi:hypothetical protein